MSTNRRLQYMVIAVLYVRDIIAMTDYMVARRSPVQTSIDQLKKEYYEL